MSVYSKSILAVGTYHSPDGVVDVTPARLKHWEADLKKITKVGYAIPSHFDHAPLHDLELLQPIHMSALRAGTSRSAKASVGMLESFKVAPDGQSAELVLRTSTRRAKEAVEKNTVFVSPVIWPQWKDGAGNKYQDVITSFDLVDHPVDYRQTSFKPAVAIRMGFNTQPIFLGGIVMTKRDDRSRLAKKHNMLAALRMGTKPDDDDDEKDELDAAEAEGAAADAEMGEPGGAGDEATNEMEPMADDSSDAYDGVDQVLDLLEEFGVRLPDDTTDDNLVRHLRVALTALLSSGGNEMDDPNAPPDGQDPNGGQPTAATPQIATMSTNDPFARYAAQQHATQIDARLSACLANGQCTPAEVDAQRRSLGPVRLSLGKDGKPIKNQTELWLESRESIPHGAVWSNKQKTDGPARLSLIEAPDKWNSPVGRSSKETEEAIKALS